MRVYVAIAARAEPQPPSRGADDPEDATDRYDCCGLCVGLFGRLSGAASCHGGGTCRLGGSTNEEVTEMNRLFPSAK